MAKFGWYGLLLSVAVGHSSPVLAQGPIIELKIDAGARSQAADGTLRCDVGEEHDFALIGEDASMSRVPLEPLAPSAQSSNQEAVRAAVPSYSSNVVLIRCVASGEAWVVAEAGGVRAVYPVLVGKARRQAKVTAPVPSP